MVRIRLVVPILVFGIATVVALVPSVTNADNPPAITIHEGGDPTSWGYTPTNTTVAVGQTVTWTNSGAVAHDAAATDGSWKTSLLEPGASGSVTFSVPGTYTYICTPHPWMQATIVVTAAPSVAPTAAPADTSTGQPANTTSPQDNTASTQPASSTAPDPGTGDGN
jgi:plastocyanin